MFSKQLPKLLFLMLIVLAMNVCAQRIYVQGNKFYVGEQQIWLNGTNTPWDNWNDFGGTFDSAWWQNEFKTLNEMHINCTRVWITCDCNNSSIEISENGYISQVSDKFWRHVDYLMNIARENHIYVMIALISFDHTSGTNHLAYKWINMYENEDNRQAFVDNYALPFVQRYKDNPYFFAIDVGNELDWVWESQGVDSDKVIDLVSRTADAVKANSDVLVCQGWGTGVKYNTSIGGCSGNYLKDVDVDFYNIHFYDWQNQWFGNPFDRSPRHYQMDDKPCIVGETPAKGAAGYNPILCYKKTFEQGWQGLMVWTSNGVDGNGNKMSAKPGTDWIYKNFPDMVTNFPAQEENVQADVHYALLQNWPNPFNSSTSVSFQLPTESHVRIEIYNMSGSLVTVLVNGNYATGQHTVVWQGINRMGNIAPTGPYFYKMITDEYVTIRKMMFIR